MTICTVPSDGDHLQGRSPGRKLWSSSPVRDSLEIYIQVIDLRRTLQVLEDQVSACGGL